MSGAAACAEERDKGMEQEWNIVFSDIKVAVVDLGGPRHVIKLLGGDLGTVGVVENLAGGLVLCS